MHGRSAALSLLSLLAAACGAGPVATALRPPDIKAAEAVGEACAIRDDRAFPLIVDWNQPQRAEIEADMARQIAVVAYDCKTIQILPDCHIEGSYGYVGVSEDEQVVQLKNADALRANLPRTGARLGVELDADLARGASIDLALVMVGRRRTDRIHAGPSDLVGECRGATHFVRGAVVGAFAMRQGDQAKVRGAVEIFGGSAGASSLSSRVQHTTTGSLEACKAARTGDAAPPARCAAVYRIELTPIDAGAPAPLDDDARTLQAYRTGCEAGIARGCSNLGTLYEQGKGVPEDVARAIQLYEQGCDGGDALGCTSLGVMYSHGKGVAQDDARAAWLYEQGCEAGDALGCTNLGYMVRNGQGVARDDARAARLYKRGCDGGNAHGCDELRAFGGGSL